MQYKPVVQSSPFLNNPVMKRTGRKACRIRDSFPYSVLDYVLYNYLNTVYRILFEARAIEIDHKRVNCVNNFISFFFCGLFCPGVAKQLCFTVGTSFEYCSRNKMFNTFTEDLCRLLSITFQYP